MSQSSTPSSDVPAAQELFVRNNDGTYRPARADEVLRQARYVLSRRVRRGATMSSPEAVKDFLRLRLGRLDHELFTVLYLDAQNLWPARPRSPAGPVCASASLKSG